MTEFRLFGKNSRERLERSAGAIALLTTGGAQ
jgi:hypothetical protein